MGWYSVSLDQCLMRRGSVPFSFENMWLIEEMFKELLKSWSQGFNFNGFFGFILAAKLKAPKNNLKTWNKEVFGNVGIKKGLALHQVIF